MKKTTRIATWKYVVSLTLSVLCILTALFVELTAVDFALKSIEVQNAENEGKAVTRTANGFVTWNDQQKEAYNDAVEAKKELIATNDVAKFFSDLAGSTTGRIFRWLVPAGFLWVLCISAKYAYAAICILPRRFCSWWAKTACPALSSWRDNLCKRWNEFATKAKGYLSKKEDKENVEEAK